MHHSRRKSGNTSMTDVKKAVAATDPSRFGKRPSTLSRRQTPVTVQKLGKNPRDREREWQDSWDDERESFPQFCVRPSHMSSFLCTSTNTLLSCRKHDQHSASTGRSHSQAHPVYYPYYSAGDPEPRDIVPRASPSRPNSMHFSPPTTPGATNGGAQYSSAISALRSLSIRPPSPPSPTSSHASLWPFNKSSAASPSSSYNRSGNASFFPATYDGAYPSTGHAYNYNNYSSSGMDRPLPTRRPTGPGYSRPKSIELVTPMVGR
ncbi:hypothetical protein CMUS01_01747 [Colletotrichum musicola]|uniref:Uncharacterized protein n=1 Tax=Colletotrichum musicola TaxID=2175873 RepID=A0A8H6NW69_9PEZI|nr:hypothetical protein CMUS01_01747 [Colletotrichum musicola]